MRIASEPVMRHKMTIVSNLLSLAVLGAMMIAPCGAYAADTLPSVPPPPLLVPTLTPAAPAATDSTKQGGNDMQKSIAAMEDKTADNAKSMMKKLDNTNDPMMLEDLNSARQTVARIEAMIDIEKHLVELDKLRGEHSKGGASLASAIPASALTPMPPRNAPDIMHEPPPRKMSMETEIVRIQGSDGKYQAVLKLSDGGTKTVRVGDHLASGNVRSITPSSVEIDESGTMHTLHIKNADAIYSAMR